ncbi:uncharacterized protein LOC144386326 isoform X1 [Gasterosteus aculeatus]
MAVCCRLSLRMLWVSCLLLCSVTCLPAPRAAYDSPAPGSGLDNSWYANAGVGSAGPAFYSGSSDSGYATFPAAGEEEASKPVFSDVSDLEPVYSFKSRSRYNNGRRQFTQTLYIPGEVLFPPMPLPANSPGQPVKDSQ